jgi:hypothetical protein
MFVKELVERKVGQDFSALACFPFGGPGLWVYQQAAATTGFDPAWDLVNRGQRQMPNLRSRGIGGIPLTHASTAGSAAMIHLACGPSRESHHHVGAS